MKKQPALENSKCRLLLRLGDTAVALVLFLRLHGCRKPSAQWRSVPKLSEAICAFGNALLGLRFGGGVGQDFRCLRAADLSQYVGQHVQFCRVQAVFVAGFWAGAQGFRPALFCHGLLPYQNGSHAD